MSVKESALSAITSLTQSDFVRVVTSAGASRRITFGNLLSALLSGTGIPDNSDLNDYSTYGVYYSASSSSTASMANKPSALAASFCMLVVSKGGQPVQLILDYSGKIYLRGRINAGWQPWYTFEGTAG